MHRLWAVDRSFDRCNRWRTNWQLGSRTVVDARSRATVLDGRDAPALG
ncbi:MAG: hypothetical protein AVDCRST_MAG59-3194 [uncultured Thermomicrobiales bacterium]|uniref:Uncharacterized protein n=1 Tax=uncultured Thermomicrobiales bacterium TaxID=1645740 RepID=A0A6J4V3Q2_9BACT|nr:MAG: hypothetical protein AVDCRST_MAG59-3194 [uncultured Thermomicrobiales bacterium]